MDKIPKISFVLAARNDDYGRNFLNRIRTSIRVLAELTERNRAAFELIIVEYCPPVDRPSLADALAEIAHPVLPIRIITVPASFHNRVRGESKNPFLEYIAKNIGIRRAYGEYIIATNPDIIFSDNFIRYLAITALDANMFYRANRHDLNIRTFDERESVDSILARCEPATTRIWTSRGQQYVSLKRWWQRLGNHLHPISFFHNLMMCPLFNIFRQSFDKTRPHGAAAGDFIMAHRDAWEKIRGYD